MENQGGNDFPAAEKQNRIRISVSQTNLSTGALL